MTKSLQQPLMEDSRGRKRVLKPLVEKKRRDRINKSLAELRTLLLNSTSDPRLQNPKLEKAEILDLALEHLHKWTEGKDSARDCSGCLHPPEPPSPLNMEGAGFQQCVAQMISYMNKISPAQRTGLLDGLRNHVESLQTQTRAPEASLDLISTSESKDKSLVLTHTPPQPLMCSTPSHDTLTPPTSPWFSPSFSAFSPTFPSFACHFSFPPSLSPLSTNASFSTLPVHGHLATVSHPVTSLRPPPLPARREVPLNPLPMWRPWF